MDLSNLSSTPTQLDSVIQRRPSLSSLSSASGYDSSTYNPGTATVGTTAVPLQMHPLRMTNNQNRIYAGLLSNLSSTNLGPGGGGSGNAGAPLAKDVGPWVELQKQQQSLTVDALDITDKKADFAPTPNASTVDDDDVSEHDDDELIPTAIVIKNIPFAIKKEQLLDVMTKLNLPLPYAFNYHFDNGVFRGLAFANFTSTDETSAVVSNLNGREIGGRKLRVEYKKMLPLQERERIEREKREKRGQLEEQHRSTSNASLASLLSVASTTAATKNLSVNGQNFPAQTERLLVQFPSASSSMFNLPNELNFNDPEVLDLYSQLLTFRDDNSKLIFEMAFASHALSMGQRKVLSLVCSFLNLLELFDNGLIIIRRKPGQQTIQQRQQQSANFSTHLHHQHTPSGGASSAHNANVLSHIPSQMTLQGHPTQMQVLALNGVNMNSLHSSSMMNLDQLPALLYTNNAMSSSVQTQPPELLRSQSQSALPLPRMRQQSSTPVQQLFSQYLHPSSSHTKLGQGSHHGKYQNYGAYATSNSSASHQQSAVNAPTSSSAAALLRSSNNRSFVDVRSPSALNTSFQANSNAGSPTPQHHSNIYQQPNAYYGNNNMAQISQPGTPINGADLSNRFTPFGQHAHLSGSMTSLQANSTSEDYTMGDLLNGKINSLSLGGGFEQQKASGIWGPKK